MIGDICIEVAPGIWTNISTSCVTFPRGISYITQHPAHHGALYSAWTIRVLAQLSLPQNLQPRPPSDLYHQPFIPAGLRVFTLL